VAFSSERKRACTLAVEPGGREVVAKGAADVILQRCTRLRTPTGDVELAPQLASVTEAVSAQQQAGQVIAVAIRRLSPGETADANSDTNLTLLGLIELSDPPRPGAADALARAEALHVQVKIVTGDALPRAKALAAQIGIPVSPETVVSAEALRGPGAGAVAARGRVFGDVVPADKYRLVRALQAQGDHVAVTGDGVNDAPALRAADVGIAMATGSDAAKGAADLVLLEDDLGVIVEGIAEGRRLFTNINRYLLYTMVSNFSNVIVVAIASLFLSFLPLLPSQVLVLNLIADLPMLAIVTDRVAAEDVATPRHWDLRSLFGIISYQGILNALFAFGLLRILGDQPVQVIYSSWFLLLGETALLILFVVRTPGWSWKAPPVSFTLGLSMGVAFLIPLVLINVPVAQELFRFAPLPWTTQAGILVYSLIYVLAADALKHAFARLGSAGNHAKTGQLPAGSNGARLELEATVERYWDKLRHHEARVTVEIQSALDALQPATGHNIRVDVDHGVAYLRGEVASEDQKREAERIADHARPRGVTRIVNELRVKPE
jgi:Mg2+-importing ATPase